MTPPPILESSSSGEEEGLEVWICLLATIIHAGLLVSFWFYYRFTLKRLPGLTREGEEDKKRELGINVVGMSTILCLIVGILLIWLGRGSGSRTVSWIGVWVPLFLMCCGMGILVVIDLRETLALERGTYNAPPSPSPRRQPNTAPPTLVPIGSPTRAAGARRGSANYAAVPDGDHPSEGTATEDHLSPVTGSAELWKPGNEEMGDTGGTQLEQLATEAQLQYPPDEATPDVVVEVGAAEQEQGGGEAVEAPVVGDLPKAEELEFNSPLGSNPLPNLKRQVHSRIVQPTVGAIDKPQQHLNAHINPAHAAHPAHPAHHPTRLSPVPPASASSPSPSQLKN